MKLPTTLSVIIESSVNKQDPSNNDREKEVSVTHSKPGCLSGRYGILNLKDREAVSRNRLIPKSFKMQYSTIDDNKIANYNEDIIMKYWNSIVIKQTWGRRISQRLRHGIVSRAFPIISLFLLGHYGFFALLRTNICMLGACSESMLSSSPRRLGTSSCSAAWRARADAPTPCGKGWR